jgi:N-acetylneuraminic acid mutarotase
MMRWGKTKIIFFSLVVCSSNIATYATQDDYCATTTPLYDYLDSLGVQFYTSDFTPKTIAVFFHIIKPSVGQEGVTDQQVDEYLTILNNDFNLGNIYFEEVGRQITRNDDYFNNVGDTFGELRAIYSHSNALDVFFIGPGGAGNSGSIPSTSIILGMDWIGTSVISHEIGHCFNLYHTHETSLGVESVTGVDCDIVGDLICDTPADPDLNHGLCVDLNCNYIPEVCYNPPDPDFGDPYNPDTHNIMSSTSLECLDWFTTGQFARIHTSLESIESISKLIINIEAPKNLSWVNSNNHPLLSWDPVTHQMLDGYSIYRNLSGSYLHCSLFQHIADTPGDQTSYYDVTVDIVSPRFATNNVAYYVTARTTSGYDSFHSNIISIPTNTSQKQLSNHPFQDQWELTGELNLPRAGHTATLLPDGNVLVVGGRYYDGLLKITNSCELYHPESGNWTLADTMSTEKWNHTSILMNNGQVLTVGGASYQGSINTCEIYDPGLDLWFTTDTLNEARENHTATLLNDGRILVAGGYFEHMAGEWTLASCEIYDLTNGEWQLTAPMNHARGNHGAVLLPDGRVLVIGGGLIFGVPERSAEIFDPATETWEVVDSLHFDRTDLSTILLSDGRVLVIGGVDTCEIFDPTTNSFSISGPTLVPRQFGHKAVLRNDGMVLLTGNQIECELFDPVNSTWSFTSSLPLIFNHHTLTRFENGHILLAGGNVVNGTCFIYIPDSTSVEIDRDPMPPVAFSISQNFPNPFNTSTIIAYYLPQISDVTLQIIDISGKKVMEKIFNNMKAGYHQYLVNMADYASGVYIYVLSDSRKRLSRKMLLVK